MTKSIQAISKLFLILALACVPSCAHRPTINTIKPTPLTEVRERREQLIGKWYAEAPTKDGLLRKTLMDRHRDGTYSVKFQLFKNTTKTLEQVELGIWGVSGNVYFTATRQMLIEKKLLPVDTSDPAYYDAYTIQSLDRNRFQYRALDNQDAFEMQKVDNGFDLE